MRFEPVFEFVITICVLLLLRRSQSKLSLKSNLSKVGLRIPARPPSTSFGGRTQTADSTSRSGTGNLGSRMSMRSDELRQPNQLT